MRLKAIYMTLSIFFKKGYFAIALGFVFVISIVTLGFYLSYYPTEVAESVAKDDAAIYTRALSSFRSLYTKLVVQPAKERGVEITHELSKKGNTLLLPATMTRLIGEEIARNGEGGEAYLYSPYPFPWRKNDGGLKDDFAKMAWQTLNKDSKTSFSRFEIINGTKTLRYATADIMRPACIQCHNTHPQSPRRGWKEGDVRGILEVRRPVENVVIQASNRAENIFWLVVGIGLLGVLSLAGMFVLIRKLKTEITAREEGEELVKEQQIKLISSSKLSTLGEMAGGVAHEINNPLAIIQTLSGQLQELLENEIPDPVLVKGLASQIETTTTRIATIVRGLRSFSRDGSRDPFQLINAKKLIEQTLSLCNEKFISSGITVTIKTTGKDFDFEARETEISQVIFNLLSNAHDAILTYKEKWIKIEIVAKNEWIEIQITDCGKGIPTGLQEKIFQPFFTTKEIGKGMGMGLSISIGIIKNLNGELRLDTQCSNTCFVIRFPKKQLFTVAA